MSVARLHHYVPQCYLKNFTRGRTKKSQFYVVDISGEIQPFWTTPRNVCAVRDFNRVEIPGQPPDVLEKEMSKFEGDLGSALKTIADSDSLGDAEAKTFFLNFVSLVATRNPHMRATAEDFHARVMRMVGRVAVETPERYAGIRAGMRKKNRGEALPDVSYERVRDFVNQGEYELDFPPGYHIPTEFSVQNTALQLLGRRNWKLLRAPSDAEFITSDLPSCLLPTKPNMGPLGYGLKNTVVVVPVTSSLLAFGSWEGSEGTVDVSREVVATFNLAIAGRCDRMIFSKSDQFEAKDDLEGGVTVGAAIVQRMEMSPRPSRDRPSSKGDS